MAETGNEVERESRRAEPGRREVAAGAAALAVVSMAGVPPGGRGGRAGQPVRPAGRPHPAGARQAQEEGPAPRNAEGRRAPGGVLPVRSRRRRAAPQEPPQPAAAAAPRPRRDGRRHARAERRRRAGLFGAVHPSRLHESNPGWRTSATCAATATFRNSPPSRGGGSSADPPSGVFRWSRLASTTRVSSSPPMASPASPARPKPDRRAGGPAAGTRRKHYWEGNDHAFYSGGLRGRRHPRGGGSGARRWPRRGDGRPPAESGAGKLAHVARQHTRAGGIPRSTRSTRTTWGTWSRRGAIPPA